MTDEVAELRQQIDSLRAEVRKTRRVMKDAEAAELRQQTVRVLRALDRKVTAQSVLTRRVNTQLVRTMLEILIELGVVPKDYAREFLEATLRNMDDLRALPGPKETSEEIKYILLKLVKGSGVPKSKPAERRRQLKIVPRP